MKRHTLFFAAVLGLLTAAAPAQNLDLPYSSGSTGADGSFTVPEKGALAMKFGFAYDAERQEAVKFGGQTNIVAGTVTNQTWVYDGQNWLQKFPAQSPSARRSCAMAYDALRKQVIMFGGESAAGTKNAETWLWDGTNWTQAAPTISPSARTCNAMAWDPLRERIVLFGGTDATGTRKQDTWLWSGTDWEAVDPPVKPSARDSATMTFYPSTQSVILLFGEGPLGGGGGVNHAYAADIWSWNGQNWATLGALPSGLFGSIGASAVYDPIRDELLVHGGEDSGSTNPIHFHMIRTLYAWKQAGAWVKKQPSNRVPAFHGAVWHEAAGEMVLAYGYVSSTLNDGGGNAFLRDETWAWDGYDWIIRTGSTFMFDQRSKQDAIWNFTDITIPSGYRVQFRRNGANNPVLWLASGNVVINGVIDLNGESGKLILYGDIERRRGGAGGFDGGMGGNTSLPAQAGRGPGGGNAGLNGVGSPGRHATSLTTGVYGSAFAQPLIGGSGGGGGFVPSAAGLGGQGGGGGGALLIASSGDITVNGTIEAIGGSGGPDYSAGGSYGSGGGSYAGGAGSGGTVRLVADRVVCTSGTINAGNSGDGKGRVRLEGLLRAVDPTRITGTYSASVPVAGSALNQAGGRLTFTKVAGENVANPPRGDQVNPDVTFTASGDVQIEIQALNVPDGTPVTVTINHSLAGTINLPTGGAVTLQQGKAIFTETIPAGQGVMQAFATYNVGGPPPAP